MFSFRRLCALLERAPDANRNKVPVGQELAVRSAKVIGVGDFTTPTLAVLNPDANFHITGLFVLSAVDQ